MTTVDEIVASWCTRDQALAFLPGDKSAIDATRGARAILVEIMRERGGNADLFPACAVLGRLIAESGGSPSLASSVIDTARQELPDLDTDTARAARAALSEGFVAARAEIARAEAMARWEHPGCAVPLENASVAIAAGYPD